MFPELSATESSLREPVESDRGTSAAEASPEGDDGVSEKASVSRPSAPTVAERRSRLRHAAIAPDDCSSLLGTSFEVDSAMYVHFSEGSYIAAIDLLRQTACFFRRPASSDGLLLQTTVCTPEGPVRHQNLSAGI
jgi:hypothetical protein